MKLQRFICTFVVLFCIISGCKTIDIQDIIGIGDGNDDVSDEEVISDTGDDLRYEKYSQRVDAMESGILSITVHDMKHEEKENEDGGHEFMILSLYGDFGRVLLFHASGGSRSVRFKVQEIGMQMEIASDNLPGPHVFQIRWGGGFVASFLDGQMIGHKEVFNGKPTRLFWGGNQDAGRAILAGWSDGTVSNWNANWR